MSYEKVPFLCVDVETTGLSPHKDRLHGFAIAISETRARYFPAWDVPAPVKAMLEDRTIEKINHHIRFDAKFLRLQGGIELAGQWHCTKQMAMLIDENAKNGLKDLTAKYFGVGNLEGKNELDALIAQLGLKHVGDLCRLDLDDPRHPYQAVIAKYCIEDVLNTLKLYKLLGQKLMDLEAKAKDVFNVQKGPMSYYFDEAMPTEKVLYEMELRGVAVNTEIITSYGDYLKAEQAKVVENLNAIAEEPIKKVEARLLALALAEKKTDKGRSNVLANPAKYGAAFNWASGQHVGDLLYSHLGAAKHTTASGLFDTSEGTLQEVGRDASLSSSAASQQLRNVLAGFAEFQGLKKEITTYVGSEDSGLLSHVLPTALGPMVFAEYPQNTNTGRTSSRNPNMQNIPRGSRIKRAFIPGSPDNVFVYADFSQVELRIAAHLSQDPGMLDWFNLGLDPHRITAADIFGVSEESVTPDQRQGGKTFNFMIIYDGGPMRIQEAFQEINRPISFDTAKEFKANWFASHAPYLTHLDMILEQARKYGAVIAENGRIRRVPDIILGDYLSYKRGWQGPKELTQRLLLPGEVKVPHKELTNRAGKKFAHAKKQAYNFPVQSVGASITKAAMGALRTAGYDLVTQVHDSIVVELPKERVHEAEWISKLMINAYKLSVPLAVDTKVLNSLDEKDKFSLDHSSVMCDDDRNKATKKE